MGEYKGKGCEGMCTKWKDRRTVLINVGELSSDRSHGDLEQEQLIRVCTIPLHQRDHVEARSVVHLPALREASAERCQPLGVVPCSEKAILARKIYLK